VTNVKLQYVQESVVKGRVYRDFRCPGRPLTRLFGEPGSAQFLTAYAAALHAAEKPKAKSSPKGAASLDQLVVGYYQSNKFLDLKPITKKTYRSAIEQLRREHGHRSYLGLERKHVMKLLDGLTVGVRINRWRALRVLFRYAQERELRRDNPMKGVPKPAQVGDGFRHWTDEDIAKFEAFWPEGSKQRLALTILRCTAQRRQDVVRLGRQHRSGNSISVVQEKTGTRLEILMHPMLVSALAKLPAAQMTFIVTEYGVPFSGNGFGQWFSEAAQKAGLPKGCTAHGVRKAACRTMAEAGCTTLEIAAVSGHRSLRELQVYTAAADQKRLAQSAIRHIV
jgi:site-specific recombinase XerD